MSKDNKFNAESLKDTGKFFRDRRKELGFTQAQVADCAGIRKHYLGAFENGKQNISFNVLMALGGCLGLKIQYLTKDTKERPSFSDKQKKSLLYTIRQIIDFTERSVLTEQELSDDEIIKMIEEDFF